ncbi:hypothetical protein ACQJBY_008959 [Aegilops geniculata]
MPRTCLATLTVTDDPADMRLACLTVRRNLSAKLGKSGPWSPAASCAPSWRRLYCSGWRRIAEAALGILADVAAASAVGRWEMVPGRWWRPWHGGYFLDDCCWIVLSYVWCVLFLQVFLFARWIGL